MIRQLMTLLCLGRNEMIRKKSSDRQREWSMKAISEALTILRNTKTHLILIGKWGEVKVLIQMMDKRNHLR
jgi:hypothetical protein